MSPLRRREPAHIVAAPIHEPQDPADTFIAARTQLSAVGFQAEHTQAEHELTERTVHDASQRARSRALREADRALDQLHQHRETASDPSLTRVQGLLQTEAQHRRFAHLRRLILDLRNTTTEAVSLPLHSTAWPTPDRFLKPAHAAPDIGSLFGQDDRLVVIDVSREPFYLSQRMIDEQGIFEYEGLLMIYVYYRHATEAEYLAGHERAAQQAAEARLRAEAERDRREADPATHANIVRQYVEAQGQSGSTQGRLAQTLFTWPPSVLGQDTVTLSREGGLVRVVHQGAPSGHWLRDRATYTVRETLCPDEVSRALGRLTEPLP
ncbi:hypothetical protein MF271_22915 (plasmid) [Deinococcus sp. KNUC1210]|uniref:hypothetical protein n=1 Tax=Deinococcus sp. KNUC1210 TaxID=2917691 RepID=UPI001EEFF4E6|nr:hypothetical protein [Deinococcus sp. KNUC1210]ULH18314.1 hypothetical protein MF271_22915 [Deinococcus sp. KNUC1210]